MEASRLSNVIHLDLPGTYQYLNVLGVCIVAMLERAKIAAELEMLAYQTKLAVHEACTNIVEHAYAGQQGRIYVTLSLEENPWRLIVQLQDTGLPFLMPEIKQPNLDEIQTSGYGLFLMHNLMDQVRYFPQTGNNRWELVKNL